MIVLPTDAEYDNAVWLRQALQDSIVLVLLVLQDEGHQAFSDFADCLMELGLAGIATGKTVHEFFDLFLCFSVGQHSMCSLWERVG